MTTAGIAASRFPPSFDGNPWSYGFALFSLTLVSAVALAILASYFLEQRNRREISRRLDNWMPLQSLRGLTPLKLHRAIVSGLLLTIVFGALPDVLVLLAWGEATERTMEVLFQIDRIGDGLTSGPLLVSAVLIVWGGQSVEHRLALDAVPLPVRPSVAFLKNQAKRVGVVLLISIGVTLAKSVA